METFNQKTAISQLIRNIILWGSLEVLFLKYVINAPWVLIIIFVMIFIVAQIIKFFIKKYQTIKYG